MPQWTTDRTSIYYEDTGEGPPLLLLAPGGLDSVIGAWSRAAIDPLTQFGDEFRLIAMDQRNAGRSTGPFEPDDPWGSYLADQLGLMDHLGIDHFCVMGCCIGCSYALGLAARSPERIRAAVLEQPIGLTETTREYWVGRRRDWVANLIATRSDLDADEGERFGAAMWSRTFVGSVGRDEVASVGTPLLVLPGVDDVHPTATGREVGQLAPTAETVEPWKDTPDHIAAASARVRDFLMAHSGA